MIVEKGNEEDDDDDEKKKERKGENHMETTGMVEKQKTKQKS